MTPLGTRFAASASEWWTSRSRVGQLVETARQSCHLSALFKPADRCGGNAVFDELPKPYEAMLLEQRKRLFGLCWGRYLHNVGVIQNLGYVNLIS